MMQLIVVAESESDVGLAMHRELPRLDEGIHHYPPVSLASPGVVVQEMLVDGLAKSPEGRTTSR